MKTMLTLTGALVLLILFSVCTSAPVIGIDSPTHVMDVSPGNWPTLTVHRWRNMREQDLERILAQNDVNARSICGMSALMWAASESEDEDVLRMLINAGASLNARNSSGETALLLAAKSNQNARVLDALIDAGANINTRTEDGMNPLMIASAYNGNVEIIALLISRQMELHGQLEGVETALLLASLVNRNPEIHRELISAGANVNHRNAQGETALILAARFNDNPHVARLLMELGANVRIQDNADMTALDHATNNTALRNSPVFWEIRDRNYFFRIGVVVDQNGRADMSFNDMAYEGLSRLARRYGGSITEEIARGVFDSAVEMSYLAVDPERMSRDRALRTLAEEGYDLVFATGFAFTDAVYSVAQDFPATHFALVDGFIPDLRYDSNITSIAFAVHEGSFLVGALAGLMVQETGGRVGFIGGMDIPMIHKYYGGFAAGAMYANPALRESGMILGQHIGQDPTAFNDPKTAERIAVNMFHQGAQIIYHGAGASGAGVFKAAYDMGRWAMGADSDQRQVYANSDSTQDRRISEYIVSSMVKRVDSAVYLLSSDFIDGRRSTFGGYVTYGVADNGVDYAVNDLNREMVAPFIEELQGLRHRIIDGDIVVPHTHVDLAIWAAAIF